MFQQLWATVGSGRGLGWLVGFKKTKRKKCRTGKQRLVLFGELNDDTTTTNKNNYLRNLPTPDGNMQCEADFMREKKIYI